MSHDATLRLNPHIRYDSWKAIAAHLGCSIRTAQRWYAQYSLPVRHVGLGPGRVFAYAHELDVWLLERPAPHFGDTMLLNEKAADDFLADRKESSEFGRHAQSAATRRDRTCEFHAVAESMWNTLAAADFSALTRLYREALDSDPEDARAFAGITFSLLAGGLLNGLTASSSRNSASYALRRCVEIDPELTEVRTARAWFKFLLEHDSFGARRELDAALDQRPDFGPAVVARSLLHIADGRLSDAIAMLSGLTEHYPLNAPAIIMRCWAEYLSGDSAAVRFLVAQARRAGLAGSALHALEALSLIDRNDPERGMNALRAKASCAPIESSHYCLLQSALGYCSAVAGHSQDARQILQGLLVSAPRQEIDIAYPIALIAFGLKDFSTAVHWLNESCSERSLWSLGAAVDPILAPLRSHPQLMPLVTDSDRPAQERNTAQSMCLN